ncbi:sialate O-acetylesterase [Desertivirga xinjiangensis]|uniref:sialate O-acetylesterase n=1 Tax=Desertivirga xinjiangensis TaxID=539206 RepID=UPI002108BC21|nr:sialate O-acetylesterase [Pedobacter xinjiangensis]
MIKFAKHILIFGLLLALSKKGFSALKLADALQNNMVVQQNKPFRVWGKADPGKTVKISADWLDNPLSLIADKEGGFLGSIEVPLAKKGDFTPHTLRVQTSDEQITLNNIWIGDVWFCSGQSNMQFAVKEMLGAEEVIKDADQAAIRLLNVGLNFSAVPIGTFSGKWLECSPETVKGFSAVAYTFGKKLHEELSIPIGLIFSGIGASAVQAYIPQEELASDVLLNDTYLLPFLKSPKSKETVDSGFSFEKVVRPFLLYNAIVNPFVNLSIKGFCWYQGEANHMERESYVKATQVLIKSWRNNFKQGDLPFYYVQIAPYFHDKEDDKLAYDAFFREAQQKVSELNNTEMVCTMDVGEARDLHPRNKKPVGLRLASAALNRTYNQHHIPYQGPEYNYVSFKKTKAYVHFKPGTTGAGLTTNDGTAPKFFYLAGEDHVFHPATAIISGHSVILSTKSVKRPVAVRYAFFNYPVTNLQNTGGFPALPFRTDNWNE